ncbi:MAG: hypothetical protein Q8M03_02705 [Legionella sp.]|nr:hypothetical protein [Legionella sp.]
MIDRYLRLLESFKEHQISALLLTIREKILSTIQSDYSSSRANEYFEDVETCPLFLMAEPFDIADFPADTNAAYVVTPDNTFYYFNRKEKDSLIALDIMKDCAFFLMAPPLSIENFPHDINTAFAVTPDNKLYYFNRKNINTTDSLLRRVEANDEEVKRLVKELKQDEIVLDETETAKLLIKRLSPAEIVVMGNTAGPVKFKQFLTSLGETEKLPPPVADIKSPLKKWSQGKSILEPGQRSQLLIENLSREQKNIITNLFRHIQPFADFASQPKQIVQLKEINNALYHAQLAFTDLERVDLRRGTSRREDLSRLYHNTILHSYQACCLLTQLDFDLRETFSQEIATLVSIFSAIENYAEKDKTLKKHKDEAFKMAKLLKKSPISDHAHQAGVISGICLEQLQPNTGQIDYNFLTHFSAVLPGYIEKFTAYIQEKFSAEIPKFESTLDKQKIAALQDNAIFLLHAIENIQDSSAILSLKVIHYIRIIRHIITLSTSTIEQMGRMTETSQNAIRSNLAKIKYELLTELFALTDKIEDETLMAPGTLSKPLMNAVIPLYNELIRLAKKPVDFSVKGEELLTIEDARFIDKRLESTQHRINKAKQNLFKAEYLKAALKSFFYILEKPKNRDKRIIDLPKSTKLALSRYYRYLQPYFEKLDIDLNNEIILNFEKESDKWDKTRNIFYRALGTNSTDSITNIIAYKNQLTELVDSELATQNFHIALNNDIISSVYQRADLTLRPLNPELCELTVNEARVLNLDVDEIEVLGVINKESDVVMTNPLALSSEQALILFEYYEDSISKHLRAKSAFIEFVALLDANKLKSLPQLDNPTKEKLRNLYILFQPYFIGFYADDAGITLLDRSVIANLKPDQSNSKPAMTEGHFLNLQKKFDDFLDNTIQSREARKVLYEELAREKFREENQARKLIPNYSYGNRAHHIIKHTRYSKAVHKFRESLFQLTGFFNQSVNNKLIPAQSGLPFPEIRDTEQLLTQCKQVVNIKRIFNSLYHLEQICIHLEQLNNKSSQSIYVSCLVKAYSHINDLKSLVIACYEDPYLSLMAKELLIKAQAIQQIFLKESEPYTKDATNVAGVKGKVKNNAIWYSLQALMLVPEHIHALYKDSPLTEKELSTIQTNTKRLIVNIEGIIASSNSYFKLFLKTPVMFRLFMELKQKLALFTNTSHEAALSHLKELNTELFARIMLETDLWEDQLGLKPGQLSGHMKLILDEFYKGLIEPLCLVSPKHIDYVTNTVTFEKRIAANDKKREDAKVQQAEVVAEHDVFVTLIHAINSYKNFTEGFGPRAEPQLINKAKKGIIDTYKKAYPLLEKIHPHLGKPSPHREPNELIDAIIQEAIPADWAKMNNITALAEIARCYYQGVISSYQLEQDTALEKNDYLQKLRIAQYKTNEGFIAKYAAQMYEKRVDTILNSQKSLLFIHKEYNTKLKENLLTFQNEIIAKVLPSEENRTIVKQSLEALMKAIPEDASLKRKIDELSSLLAVSMPAKDIAIKANKLTRLINQIKTIRNLELKISEVLESVNQENVLLSNITQALTVLADTFPAEYTWQKEKITVFLSRLTPEIAEGDLKKEVRRLLSNLSRTVSSNLKRAEINQLLDKLSLSLLSQDMEKRIKNLLLVKVRNFEEENHQDYIKLDNILSAVAEFRLYIHSFEKQKILTGSSDSLFENEKTLGKKTEQLVKLEQIAQSEEPVATRLEKLAEQVSSTKFLVNMKAHRHLNTLSFAWLQRCVLKLLAALHLYTPEHIKLYNHLTDETLDKPEINPPTWRDRFFQGSKCNSAPPAIEEAQPVLILAGRGAGG